MSASERPLRLAIVATHPIQYQVPWFQALASKPSLDLDVLFIRLLNAHAQGVGFGQSFTWDIPLLNGYRWRKSRAVVVREEAHGFFSSRLSSPRLELEELVPDAVLLTGWHAWPLLQLLFAARQLRIPVIVRGESNAMRMRPAHIRALHRALLRKPSAFLTIGHSNRAFYSNNGVPADRLFDAPYFVDNARFIATALEFSSQRDALRARWNIPSDATCFCFAGKLEPKKRVMDLLAALRVAMATTVRPLHVLIVGTGEQLDPARGFVAVHRLPVSFAGFLNQTEIPGAYVAADCLVLPSDYGETWGLVVNEAMACARPAILSDRVGCGPDLIIDGKTGFTFPCGDTDALARRMADVAGDVGRLRRMGDAAQAHVLAGYSVERAVAATVDAVRFVCGLNSWTSKNLGGRG